MRNVNDPVAAVEDIVITTRLVEVCSVQGQSARREGTASSQKGNPFQISCVAHACTHPIATVEEVLNNPSPNKSCGPRHGHDASAFYGAHQLCRPTAVTIAANKAVRIFAGVGIRAPVDWLVGDDIFADLGL